MKLSELIEPGECLNPEVLNANNPEVSSVTQDSREVQPGTLFFCALGAKFDGRVFIKDSFAKGAVAVVYDEEPTSPTPGLAIKVKDTRRAISYAASQFFGDPSKKLVSLAITGTSGKTSVAWILSHALQILGSPTFLGGTLGFKMLEQGPEAAKGIKELGNTTMDPVSVQRFLKDALASGAKSAVFEATSQGVVQNRMRHVSWNGAIFTNLTRDHLDLHGSMERYEEAKKRLFLEDLAWSPKENRFAIFNFDDDSGRRIGLELKATHPEIKVVSFSVKSGPGRDYLLSELKADTRALSFTLKSATDEIRLRSPLIGSHNAYNVACVALALKELGYSSDAIAKTIAEVPCVPGRLEPVCSKSNKVVYVDYAHKPDALEKVLNFLKPICKGRLITVFGCGGDRDRGKRPIMGEVVRRLSDVAIVTSDNPRTEEPEAIIAEIMTGIEDRENYPVITQTDRRAAIAEAIRIATADDIILLAGKGHEPYQEINGVKHPFHDGAVAKEFLDS